MITMYILHEVKGGRFPVKKVLSVLLIALMLSLNGICASADGAPAISVSSAEAHPGEEAILTVELSNNPGIVGMTVGFDYNADVMELESMTQSGLLGAWFKAVKAAWASTVGDQDYNGVFLTLKFKVSETADNGVYPVGIVCNSGDICNSALEILDFKLNSGSITVTGARTAPAPSTQPTPAPSTQPTPAARYKTAPSYWFVEAQSGVTETVVGEIEELNIPEAASEDTEKTEKAPETEKPTDKTEAAAAVEETAADDDSNSEPTETKTPVGVYALAALAAVCVIAAAVLIIRKKADNKK